MPPSCFVRRRMGGVGPGGGGAGPAGPPAPFPQAWATRGAAWPARRLGGRETAEEATLFWAVRRERRRRRRQQSSVQRPSGWARSVEPSVALPGESALTPQFHSASSPFKSGAVVRRVVCEQGLSLGPCTSIVSEELRAYGVQLLLCCYAKLVAVMECVAKLENIHGFRVRDLAGRESGVRTHALPLASHQQEQVGEVAGMHHSCAWSQRLDYAKAS